MRSSSATGSRLSHAPGSLLGAPSNALMSRLNAKRQEYDAVDALYRSSSGMLEQLEKLASQSDIMVDGGEAVGNVSSNWANTFSIIGMLAQQKSDPSAHAEESTEDNGASANGQSDTLPSLVRVEIASLPHADKSKETR